MEKQQVKNQLDNKIGFVINTDADPKGRIEYILTAHKGSENYWDVWRPRSGKDKNKDRSVREYCNALFIFLAQAILRIDATIEKSDAHNEGDFKSEAIIFYENSKEHGHIVKKVFNIIEDHEKYEEIPAIVRTGLSPLVRTGGGRGNRKPRRITIAPSCVQQVYFWDIKKEPFLSLDFDSIAGKQHGLALEPGTIECLNLKLIEVFLFQIRHIQTATTWKEIYLDAILSTLRVENFIDLLISQTDDGNSEQDSKLEQKGLELRHLRRRKPLKHIIDIVNTAKRAVILGKSGSGKTLILKYIATTFAIEHIMAKSNAFPIYVSLKHFVGPADAEISLYAAIERSILETLGSLPADRLSKYDTLQDTYETKTIASTQMKGMTYLTKSRIPERIRNEVDSWLNENHNDFSDVLFLFDGFNDVLPQYHHDLLADLREMLKKPYKIFLTATHPLASLNEMDFPIHVELQQLSNEQLIWYLNRKFPAQGATIVSHLLEKDPDMLA